MKTTLQLIVLAICIAACSTSKNTGTAHYSADYGSLYVSQVLLDENTFKIEAYSDDAGYGYDKNKPVMVGGSKSMEGPLNERRFLNALAGPNGEEISYHRLGSCCHFKTDNSGMGGGLLDRYSVTYEGLKEPVVLYINMYDSDTLKVPKGFKLKQ